MMLTQIRRDRAFRHLGPWVFASAVIAPLLIGIGVDRTAGMTPDVAPPMMVFGLWVGLALYLAFGARRRGSGLLDLALPIPARRLWLAHVLAAVLGGLVLLGSSLAALAFRGWVEGWPAWVPALAAVRLIPLLMAGHVLAVVALASLRPHLVEVSAGDGWIFLAVLLVWILPLLLGLAGVPPGWALVLFAAAATLGWRTWRQLPPALALLPREPAPAPIPGAGGRETLRRYTLLTHIRQDIAIRSLPGWLVLNPFFTTFLFVLAAGKLTTDSEHPSLAAVASWTFWLPWLPVAIYLAYGQRKRRASDFDLALPLPARRLWLAHGLSLGLGGGSILVIGAALAAYLVAGFNPSAAVGMIAAAFRLGAGLVIGVAVLESREPALVRLTPSWANSLLAAAVLTAVPVLVLRLDGAAVIVLLGLALALGFRTWRSLPAALTLEPAVVPPEVGKRNYSGPMTGQSQGGGEKRSPPERSVVPNPASRFLQIQSASGSHRLLLYCLLYPGLVSVGMLSYFLFHLGQVLVGVAMLSTPFFAVFFLMPAAQMTLSQLAMLDPLPVSRRWLFAALVIPAFAALPLGYGIGAALRLESSQLVTQVAAKWPAETVIPAEESFAIALILTGVVWLCLIALYLRFPNRRFTAGGVLFLVLYAASQKPFYFAGHLVTFAVQLAAAPGNASLVLLFVLLVAGYGVAEALFRRYDVPPQGGEPETSGGL